MTTPADGSLREKFSLEDRFAKLREVLSRFEPCPDKKKDMRLDWSHLLCLVCLFHYPMFHDDTHDDSKMICPLCGTFRRITQCSPNHPELAKWWDNLDGGHDRQKKRAEEKRKEEDRKNRKSLPAEQYFND